jgi:excisionase family DNA binding protein
MDTYLTIQEAARLTSISEQVLNELVESGNIESIMLTNGAVLVPKTQIQSWVPLEQRPEYAEFANLRGKKISQLAASKLYNVPQRTISRWVAAGMITRLAEEGRSVMIDQAEVATLCKIYREAGGGQGRWVFKSGRFYTPKAR